LPRQIFENFFNYPAVPSDRFIAQIVVQGNDLAELDQGTGKREREEVAIPG
jgi:hypothetical protein